MADIRLFKGVPEHIGIIMDGNGRWAKKRGLPRTAGHYRGAEVFQKIVRHCEKIGVKAATFYAFSTENWRRPRGEVDSIMNLLRRYLKDAFGFKDENIKITFIGDRSRMDPDIQEVMSEVEAVSAGNGGLMLNIAVNYGGREEILRAARAAASMVRDGEVGADMIDERLFDSLMYTAGSPPLDMLLRPSGECRISNFLLWQCAYCEFVFMQKLWPDFTPEDLDAAIEEYVSRDRRFGGAG